ncbi:MAG: hypothetical protein JOZ73_12890 [Solirubrobacterales bacterium]|nr:hypothetical protein [Solirubrobacterales bacterium]
MLLAKGVHLDAVDGPVRLGGPLSRAFLRKEEPVLTRFELIPTAASDELGNYTES